MNCKKIPIELWNIIFNYLGFVDKHSLKAVCKCLSLLKIEKIPKCYYRKITQNTLYSYPHLKTFTAWSKLNIECMKNLDKLSLVSYVDGLEQLTNVSILNISNDVDKHIDPSILPNLKELTVNNYVAQKDVEKLQLEKLCIYDNQLITNLTFMKSLRSLFVTPRTLISNDSIYGLNLTKLVMRNNRKIIDLNTLVNLKYLDISGAMIRNDGLQNLNLVKLKASNAQNLTNVRHMTKLIYLDASKKCGIDSYGLPINLEYLNASSNPKIKTINHLKKLNILLALGKESGINQKGISKINLIELDIANNKKISSLNHMTRLRKLNAPNSALLNIGLTSLNLEFLNVNNCPNVTNINHMTNLTFLGASKNCGITNKGMHKLNVNLIQYFDNLKINRNGMQNAYRTLDNGGRPFLVVVNVNEKTVNIYMKEKRCPWMKGNINNYNKFVRTYNYLEIMIGSGWDPTLAAIIGMTPEHPDYKNAEHNSFLLKIKEKRYVHIGYKIYEFSTLDNITEFHSPVGNSLVPYPYAIGEKNVYMLLEDEAYLDKSLFKNDINYTEFYNMNGIKCRRFKNYNLIQSTPKY